MTFVLGRDGGPDAGPSAPLGSYRALDGSDGDALRLDLNGPHAGLVVGKRGYGKSYTLGVLAEGIARQPALAPVVVDPMGVFETLDGPADGEPVPAMVVDEPRVSAAPLAPRSWCAMLDLSPESGAGSLVWRAAELEDSLEGMIARVEGAEAPATDVRAAVNHLRLARSWGVFDDDGLAAADLCGPEATVVDVSGTDAAPANAVVRAVGASLYRARATGRVDRLPWLLVDEAHAFFGGVAEPALERILTRGRAPGASVVLATQRPSAVPDIAVSQSDLVVAHRLTAEPDLDALRRAQPSYLSGSITDRLPAETGQVLILDDATETAHSVDIRSRDTPHGGGSPAATDVFVGNGRAVGVPGESIAAENRPDVRTGGR